MKLREFEAEVRAVFGSFAQSGIKSGDTFCAEVFVAQRMASIELCEIGIDVWVAWEVRPGHQHSNIVMNQPSVNEALTELKTLIEAGVQTPAGQKGATLSSHIRRRSRKNRMNLTMFRQLTESIFDTVIDVRTMTFVRRPGFQADVTISGRTLSINLQRESAGKYNAWIPANILSTQVLISGEPSARTALERLKGLVEGRIAISMSRQRQKTKPVGTVTPVQPIVIPKRPRHKVAPLDLDQCRALAEGIFKDTSVVPDPGGKENCFLIYIVMMDPMTIKLDCVHGHWLASDESSGSCHAQAPNSDNTPLRALRDLKEILMA